MPNKSNDPGWFPWGAGIIGAALIILLTIWWVVTK